MKTHEVFGITPQVSEHSYIDRGSLDKEFKKLIDRHATHIALRGASKSGKSWLRQRVLDNPIVVQCRLTYTNFDIYRDALARLEITLETEKLTKDAFKGKISIAGEGGWKLLAKVTGAAEAGAERETALKEAIVGKDLHDLEFIASLINASARTLVIEDFHYLSVEEQKKFAFDLKTLWDYSVFVVVVGVWISENMLITLNPDLSDRIEELPVEWSEEELKSVLEKGCASLNLFPTPELSKKIAEISYKSVGLLQKLSLRLIDDEMDITETVAGEAPTVLEDLEALDSAAMHVAEQLNKLYQAFAKRVCDGIRVRKNSTGIYAHGMAAIMNASDDDLTEGLAASNVFAKAHARQPRIQLGNLKTALARFQELQVDSDGRGLVIGYDADQEKVTVVDKQLLLYRRFATVRWPWEALIEEVSAQQDAFE